MRIKVWILEGHPQSQPAEKALLHFSTYFEDEVVLKIKIFENKHLYTKEGRR